MVNRMLKATAIYFSFVFALGFVLGTIRVLFVVPRVGARVPELIESPFMVLATVLAAWWVVRRFNHSRLLWNWLGTGLIAVALVLAADLVVGVGIRKISPGDVFTNRDPVSGSVCYGLLGMFGLTP
jgi:hypothetical protein